MRSLWYCLCGYIQIYLPKLIWMFVFFIVFWGIFTVIQKKELGKGEGNRKKLHCILLYWAFSFIFVMTLFGRDKIQNSFSLQPFASYFVALNEKNEEVVLQIIVNIAMYIPLGLLLPCCFKLFEKYRYVIFGTFCGSLVIELIQLVFRLGLFEVDDIINNTLGAVIGLLIYMIFKRGKNEHNKQKIS